MTLLKEIQVGSVVQISPDKDPKFAACFLLVTELYKWGVMGFVAVPTKDGVGEVYYRAKWHEIQLIGQAVWVSSDLTLPTSVAEEK